MPWLASLVASVALAAPAVASAADGAILVVDNAEVSQRFMDASGIDINDNTVNINTGDKVTFSFPSGNGSHNASFDESVLKPASCTLTQGTVIPGFPNRIPAFAMEAPWAGNCQFNAAGTYDFVCIVHSDMTGKVVVAAAANQPPTVTAARTPAGDVTAGTAVNFTATGSDPDGGTLTYSWDFGDGTTSTSQNPAHTYAAPGAFNATVTVSDGQGGSASSKILTTVYPSSCTPGIYRDNFDGNELGAAWSVIRRDETLVVSDGTLKIPAQAGDLYEAANSAKNIVVRPAPAGPWTITAKINIKALVQYQQGGIIVYGDDDNYVKLDREATNAAAANNIEVMEFIQEVAGVPRNATADRTATLGQAYPNDFYLRIVWDGTNLVGSHSQNGTTWTNVGRASTAYPENAKIGLHALSNAAETVVTPIFDWFQIEGANAPAIPGCTTPNNTDPVISSATRTPAGDVTTGTPVNFAAAATDADGDTLTYAWDFGDTTSSTQQNPTKTYSTPGTYNAKVTVSDGKGGSATQTLPIVVTQGNRAPTVTAARTPTGNVAPGTEVAFTATAADADSDPLTYLWEFSDGGTSTAQNPSHTYPNAGTFTAKVTVDDGRGGTASDTLTVIVSGPNQNPTVTANRTPTGGTRVGIPISFTAVGADADGDPLTYSWNFGDGTPVSTAQNPVHTFLTVATFNVVVTVSDGKGGTGTATLSVQVQANRAPTITSASATPSEGLAPLSVAFTAVGADLDGHTLTYEWDLDGNGSYESTGASQTRVYSASATASLRISDGFGGTVTRAFPINVFGAQNPNARYNVLIFSKTAAFRHSNIDEGITAIQLAGTQQNFGVDTTENSAMFTDEFLARYDAVIWLSTTGDVLTDPQQAAFERYIRAGGGYVGIHAATDTEYGWAWYGQLTGAYFRNHPNGTPTATVVVEDATKSSTSHLPARWSRVDEWYNFQTNVNPVVNGGGTDVSPRNSTVPPMHVLLTMDESTYVESDGTDGVNDDHPIAWCKRFEGGRMFYTALAHTEASFLEANFLQHLKGGMEVAAGVTPDVDCGVAPNAAPTVTVSRTPSGDADTGTPVQFTATGADADGDTLTYAWTFGDGGTSTAQNPTHTYAAAGSYTATVTVSDGKGGTGTASTTVVVKLVSTSVTGNVGGTVDTVLALTISGSATFGAIAPGVTNTYGAGTAATVTSTAGDATLTIADPDTVNTGRLVNGTYALASPLQARATNAANPTSAFAPVTGTANPLVLLSYSRAVSVDAVTIGFQQSVAASETLRAGSYSKSLTFTLSTTTP